MIDFHSHVLPKMDDGSRSCAESAAMLRESYAQGIDILAATSHFYANENSPEEFLRRRARSWEQLAEVLTDDMPAIRLGAEVQYFEGICRVREVDLLRLEGSQVLLLEMPFCAWSDRMVKDVLDLNRRPDYTVLLAHIERYLQWQPEEVWQELRDEGVLMQSNPSFFLNRKTRRRALKMLEYGEVDLLGSDCHNMNTRPPELEGAFRLILEKIGQGEIRRINTLGISLLEDEG